MRDVRPPLVVIHGDQQDLRTEEQEVSASCNNYGGGSCGPTVTTPPVVTVPSQQRTPTDSGLPFTGGDVIGLSVVGTMLIAIGFGLIHQPSRRRRLDDTIKFREGTK